MEKMTTKNKFRNDGEMPPEIAKRFPVVDRADLVQDDSKGKMTPTTRPLLPERSELPDIAGVFTLVCF